jgi:simple sugar transport system permease protein
MMLVGAVSAFIVTTVTGSDSLGLVAAMLGACGIAAIFGVLTLTLAANQVATGLAWAMVRTRAGMVLRAVGESDTAAHALGHNVIGVRYAAVLFGGAMAGLGGAYLSLASTPMWIEGLTAGRGWIALALVVFGAWRPWRVLAGAYLFGGINVLQLYLQGAGFVAVPTQVLAMIPYLATIVVLTAISAGGARRLQAPACLGKPFRPAN